jgi:hypothetical protein
VGLLDRWNLILSSNLSLCHLTRKTAESIEGAGFSSLSLNAVRLSSAYIISPHVYGVACK